AKSSEICHSASFSSRRRIYPRDAHRRVSHSQPDGGTHALVGEVAWSCLCSAAQCSPEQRCRLLLVPAVLLRLAQADRPQLPLPLVLLQADVQLLRLQAPLCDLQSVVRCSPLLLLQPVPEGLLGP